ncbi:unnamed protein product [Parnassius apollo]|uniref:(apollo) hypothetical protein n=1 Tax=Parnassius apollo TaxID=110799 RepID=A0A8S3WRW4_PARAO|nr:unnamed protein product [Parnassius apollo]
MSARKTMWNPGNIPVPQVFIDVLLDEEEAEEAVINEEVGEQGDCDVSSMPIYYMRSDGSWGDLSELVVEPAEVSGSPAPAPAAAPVAAPEAVPGPAPRRVEGSLAPAPAAAPVAAPEALPGPAPRRVEDLPALEGAPGPAPRFMVEVLDTAAARQRRGTASVRGWTWPWP